jgi:dUTP pyrophosphatase
MNLKVKLLREYAKIPTYGSGYAAGMDVFSKADYSIPPRSRKLIGTGISVSWSSDIRLDDEKNYYLRVAPRSGLAAKSSVDVGAGVIDYDYRGEVFVLLINNHNENQFEVKTGDKIAQLILEKNYCPKIVQVEQHTETERGAGGFGSTDAKQV